MAFDLSGGWIAALLETEGPAITPILQVADLRLINTQNQTERYRVLLSDGVHVQQCMLATQNNDLVRSQSLRRGSILQLGHYLCNTVQGRKIVVIIELKVLLEECDMIGEPKQYPPTANPSFNSYGRTSPASQQPPSIGPVLKNEAILPIAALNPYLGMWTIKARVTSKGGIRRYTNNRGDDGKVFSFDLLDSSGEIRVFCFNTVVHQYHSLIEVGKVYFISNGSLKPAQKTFNHLNNEFEITLDNYSSTVVFCPYYDNSIPNNEVMEMDFVRKTISQIEDDKLGTSEEPDYIAVIATVSFIKTEPRFLYPACPLQFEDRQCKRKVLDNGDGTWSCTRCDKTIEKCNYRYVLQVEIQDHTGRTWVTAFEEGGAVIMGMPAEDLYKINYVEHDDEKFTEIWREALYGKYLFKLKVKEDMFNGIQRVKPIVVSVEKLDYVSESGFLLDAIDKYIGEDVGSHGPSSGNAAFVKTGVSGNAPPAYGSGNGGTSRNYGGGGGSSGECFKCHQSKHWADNCPNVSNTPPDYSSGNASSGSYGGGGASGECFKCHQSGHWARDCPNTSNVSPGYGSGNGGTSRSYGDGGGGGGGASGEYCFKCYQSGHWTRDCPSAY